MPSQLRTSENPEERPNLAVEDRAKLQAAVQRLRDSDSTYVAIFLGAGASATFGYPLTRDILKSIIDNLGSTSFLADLQGDPQGSGERNRSLLKSYILRLLPGKSSNGKNLPLVTSLLSLLDYSIAMGQSVLPGHSIDEIRRARQLLERAILEVIDYNKTCTPRTEQSAKQFCAFLQDIHEKCQGRPIALITTNYDMAADRAAFESCIDRDDDNYWEIDQIANKIDFGFRWLDPESKNRKNYPRPQRPKFQVHKLHGSTNWLRCPLCDNIYINPWGSIWHHAYRQRPDDDSRCDCSPTQLQAQIVSPSFVRDMRDPNLLSVWKSALDILREADDWVIIGYSFPDEDLGVRALFTRAYGAREELPHLTILQRDHTSFDRYDAFFDSDRLDFCVGGLSAFLDQWSGAAAH
jgi:NAD-dependent SIR2 family protein deacetylase